MIDIPMNSKSDSYKYGHFAQYPKDIQYVSSYIESRGVENGRNWEQVVNAGTPYYLETFLSRPLVTPRVIEKMEKRMAIHGPSYNTQGWKDLLQIHNGMAPVLVEALPEGMVVPLGTPQMQIVNTDRRFPWISSWLETSALRAIWYPSTVATQSFHIKRVIAKYMDETAGHREGLEFKLHDFGARGASSSETAQIGGLAHLYNFMGSDTFEAIELASELYHENMAGYSVDAAEHSTITSFGGPNFERDAYEHLLDTFGQQSDKLFSVVSDSYDLFNAIDNIWGGTLKDKVVDLGTRNSKLVIRPDSGDPATIVVQTLQRLMDRFGYTLNTKGYKVLPPYIGVIQGDGINERSVERILENMKVHGLSAENIVFGMGGELLQKVNRDTLKYAMKASAASKDGDNWYDVYKDPVTDSGKRSKRGIQAVVERDGLVIPVRKDAMHKNEENLMQEVYRNGFSFWKEDMSTIRGRINVAL